MPCQRRRGAVEVVLCSAVLQSWVLIVRCLLVVVVKERQVMSRCCSVVTETALESEDECVRAVSEVGCDYVCGCTRSQTRAPCRWERCSIDPLIQDQPELKSPVGVRGGRQGR